MGISPNLVGQRFGHLMVLSRHGSKKNNVVWRCQCDCGNISLVTTNGLRTGDHTSCGCRRGGVTHGHTRGGNGSASPTYASWKSMISRCTLPSNAGFAYYHELGITICDRWESFGNFLADMGERPSLAHSLDRFPDQKGNYEPGNVRWATRIEQANNRSTNHLFPFEGEMLTYREISRRTGLPEERLRHRLLRAGWSVADAVNPQRVPGKRTDRL
jgi:hypothetical protein